MTTIQEKRVEFLTDKNGYDKTKAEFLVETGLTFDPQKLRSDKSEEDKHLDWYYPKGAGFVTATEESSEPTPTPTPDPEPTPTPTPDPEQTDEPSTVEPVEDPTNT